jgi:hypothetical protein
MNDFALKYRQPIRGFKTSTKDLFLSEHKFKPLRETHQRQTYSPKKNSFQRKIIDFRPIGKNTNQLYLILININTIYLYIYPLKKKDSDNVS